MMHKNTNYGATIWPIRQQQKSGKRLSWCSTILLISLVIGAVITYICYHNQPLAASSKVFAAITNDNTVQKQEIIIEYHAEDFDEFVSDADSDSDASPGSVIWEAFHDELISNNGFNKDNELYYYTFVVYDYAEPSRINVKNQEPETEEDANALSADGRRSRPTKAPKTKKSKPTKAPRTKKPKPTEAPKPTPNPTSPAGSGLQCYSKYSGLIALTSDSKVKVDCLLKAEKDAGSAPAAQMTGCSSNNQDWDVSRSGELLTVNGNAYAVCSTIVPKQINYKYTYVTVRCCQSVDPVVDFLTTLPAPVKSSKKVVEYCVDANCGDGIEIGCAVDYNSKTRTYQAMGLKHSDHNGCEAARHDAALQGILNQPICANVGQGTLECIDIGGSIPADDATKTIFESTASCPTDYTVTDCNNYIDNGIDQCSPSFIDEGVSYGGWIRSSGWYGNPKDPLYSATHCLAYGSSTNIRAQARCCRIQ